MKNIQKLGIAVLALVILFTASFGMAEETVKFDTKRNRFIGYLLSKQLPTLHFSDKIVNDDLAMAAFHLYIKQLDYQKRFLLKKDVEQLKAFAPYIDDNLANGRISLPDTGYDILTEKISLVQTMVETMLSNDKIRVVARKGSSAVKNNTSSSGEEVLMVGNFDVRQKETYETDPEKAAFVENLTELKDRWRKVLKAQIIAQYLDLVEEQQKGKEQKDKEKPIQIKSEEELWKEALSKVSKRNKTFFQRLNQETLQDHYDRFFNCITRAFDPHTNYIPPAGKEQFDINMRGSLEGIGALLREDDGFIKVIRIIPGSASAIQGRLKAEDIILQVTQEGEEPVDVTDMRLRDAVRLIRGPKGKAVTLTVKKPDGATEVIKIVRDVVQIEETFVKSTIINAGDGRKTGYIYIPSFYRDFEGTRNGSKGRNSTDDTLQEIESLKKQKVDGIVLDLRDDGGGALVDAVDITGLFIKTGPVVQVKNSFGDKRVLSDTDDKMYYDGPLVVLVNKFSASASEIVAAALQDYKRAVVIGGKHTHGKGTVQTIIDLNENIPLLHLKKYDDLGALKVMIQKFYRVTGGSNQWKGVESDIVLPNLFEHIKSGERYLDYSLPWDSIEAIPFTPWTDKPFDLDLLRNKSLDRVANDEGFKIIAEEAVKAAERAENTVVSIDLEDMRSKREEARLVREKVGAHYRKYREEQDEEGEFEESEDDKADPHEVWLKNVQQDPYIREAVNIVGDIIRFSKS
ncbi:MAG: tail-specific protease [Desulfobacterales bacterium GWB2_56_26]|nr:MAG: tail-specific protease [Desulfobacterales bacterium GWB2_56_26]